jgi:hypothetical protein
MLGAAESLGNDETPDRPVGSSRPWSLPRRRILAPRDIAPPRNPSRSVLSSTAVHRRSGAQRSGLFDRTAFHAIRTRASLRGATGKPATRAVPFEQA